MTDTLFSAGMLNSGVGLAMAGIIGYFFGSFLEKAGFGSSRKLTGIFYLRDMSVLKVMFTAVVTALVGYRYFVALGLIAPENVYPLETYWAAQIVGGLVFGVGFVVGGWCPGTAFVGLASAKWDALVFLVGAGLGSIIYNEAFGLIQGLQDATPAGVVLLSDSLGVPAQWVPLIFSGAAVLAFSLSTLAERKFGGQKDSDPESRKAHFAAATLLLLLALGAAFLPSRIDVSEQIQSESDPYSLIADAEEHIDPEDIAETLMRPGSDLFLVDIRGADAYTKFHIRSAVNIPMRELGERAGELPLSGRVVLYSNGTTHAAQAWLLLRTLGHHNVFVLTDGILGFWQRCLTPPSLSGVNDPAAIMVALPAYNARKAYFIDGQGSALVAPPVEAMTAPGLGKHLVDTAWLAQHQNDARLRILDVRSKSSKYSTAHIPGALYINPENLRTTIGGYHSMLLPAEEIASALGRLGLTAEHTIIVYDDRLRDAALAAVALERLGHSSYAILHGGFASWAEEKRPVTSAIPEVKPAKYIPGSIADELTVDIDSTERARRAGKTVILDVRPASYFSGAKSDEARAGHIPGAVNRPFDSDLVEGKAMWKSLAHLQKEYASIGIDGSKPVIVHCRTGHQASQTYFLLRHLIGIERVQWMDASWMAWAARADLPLEAAAE